MAQDTQTDHALFDVADEEPIVLRRKIPEDADMDITPMIDITFLLLIYFLVASHLDTDTAVELPPARYGTVVAAKESVIVTVANGTDNGAAIYLADGKIDAGLVRVSDPRKQEEEIAAYVRMGLRGELPGGEAPKKYVLLKAERGVKHREVARVAAAVGTVEEEVQLFVAVLEEQ